MRPLENTEIEGAFSFGYATDEKVQQLEKQYFLDLDALFFKGVTIPQEEQENLEPKNTAKVTVSANWPLL